ncbi:hypothetical protein, partial [Aeromonas veronii]|uniref:hypothetical protein n=1 Tax=Aeromonas veronii TaxID=654 RepID=UPI003D1E9365
EEDGGDQITKSSVSSIQAVSIWETTPVDGETAAQGCLCKSGCQVGHINRERSRVKPPSGKNLPKINKLLT